MKQLLSTLEPSKAQRQAALSIALLSVLIFLAVAPFAKVPLRHVVGFLPAYQAAFVVFDLITAVLLFAQYRMLSSASMLWLAGGYVFSALMSSAHALSFPGLFAAEGLFGDSQTTAWIYFLWHAAFPLFVLAYAADKGRAPRQAEGGKWIFLTIAGACVAAAVFVALASSSTLPAIMSGDKDAHSKLVVAIATWLSPLTTLAYLWRARPHTVLDLWVMVVLCVWTADVALAALLNGARFDVGWYAGRIYALLASGFVLGVLLFENSALYGRLAEKNAMLEEVSRERAEYAGALRTALNELEVANSDLRAFVGSLAHDLQQPITTIASFAQVLQRQPDAQPTDRERHLNKIVLAAQWAQRMIRALLDFARLGQAQLRKEAVDLNIVFADAQSQVCALGGGGSIDWRIGSLPTVLGDRSLLTMAFVNLLSNAVKYTRTTAHPIIEIRSFSSGAQAQSIQVRDNGVGFDMQKAERLFTPFERLHRSDEFEGTGMGLANVRRIIEKHGGSVSASAQPGEGAVFTVVLPRVLTG